MLANTILKYTHLRLLAIMIFLAFITLLVELFFTQITHKLTLHVRLSIYSLNRN